MSEKPAAIYLQPFKQSKTKQNGPTLIPTATSSGIKKNVKNGSYPHHRRSETAQNHDVQPATSQTKTRVCHRFYQEKQTPKGN